VVKWEYESVIQEIFRHNSDAGYWGFWCVWSGAEG